MTNSDPTRRPSTEDLLANPLFGNLRKNGSLSTNPSASFLFVQDSQPFALSCQNSLRKLNRGGSRVDKTNHKELKKSIISSNAGGLRVNMRRSFFAPMQAVKSTDVIRQYMSKYVEPIIGEDKKAANEEDGTDELEKSDIACEYNDLIKLNIQ
eukprot:TRINITY_DN3555_c0_g1_i1.p2 TRINITY_DN3555_c0_g1~~TRINITY_DN3555_c0_g1_i1.p2  ORF type:complete len:153 (+),score=25.58 TRINITY_DN3555_c0_g1_i1:1108-1566(+)